MHATRTWTCLALVCSVFTASHAVAQERVLRISMGEALRLFGENGLALQIARADALEIEGLARQSRAYFNPTLSLVREHLGRGAEDYSETTIGIGQRLEWPGRTAARFRVAGHRIDAAAAGLRADSIRLAFEVRRAYTKAWAAEAREQAQRRTLDVILRVAAAAETRLVEGDISGYQARRLRLERVRVLQDVDAAELETAATRRMLASLVLPSGEFAQVAPSEPLSGQPPTVERARALDAILRRPDLEAAAARFEAARAQVSVASSAWVPDPTLTIGYKEQADGFSGAALGVAVPIPLFNRGSGGADAARAQSVAAEVGLDLRRREARNDVVATADRYASMRRRLETVGSDLMAEADALLAAANAAYDEGEMTLLELLDAARAFRDAGFTAVSLQADTWIAYYDLLRAIGRGPEEER